MSNIKNIRKNKFYFVLDGKIKGPEIGELQKKLNQRFKTCVEVRSYIVALCEAKRIQLQMLQQIKYLSSTLFNTLEIK